MTLPTESDIERAFAALPLQGFVPSVGLVLGSGLGAFAERLEERSSVDYGAIPGMPQSAVVGHRGVLHWGNVAGVSVACLQGRVHAYEGHSLDRVCFGVTLLARMGCHAVLLTNAAGGVDSSFSAGDLMLITDHLNLTGSNPLLGAADSRCPRFVDMTSAYDGELGELATAAASKLGFSLQRGVYAGMLGPSYETPAEIRMLRTFGAAAVGMSTVPEVLALRALGVRVGAVSCITNLAAGAGTGPITHDEVQVTAARVQQRFEALLVQWIESIGATLH